LSANNLLRVSPSTILVENRRFVADEGIITSTGVSASLPLSLSLVEAIANKATSDELAVRLGVSRYDEQHDSDYFRLRPSTIYRVVANSIQIFSHERIGLDVANGVDELSLALVADAWSRTYRSKAFTVSGTECVKSLNGLEIIPDFTTDSEQKFETYAPIPDSPGNSLNSALAQIADRHSTSTALNVALQLEYPWQQGN
jgi:transcriptional regulator GlxA family with amidase domain